MTDDTGSLIDSIVNGDRRAVARAISMVEDQIPGKAALLKQLFARGSRTFICGITGPPGAGKSSLVDRLAVYSREKNEEVGIVCVDPTSPFSGGALLGDRIRMAETATDPGVFIRSMATRGSRGGLARAAREVALLLGATGRDSIFLETVGVGQIELDIAGSADTIVVVLVPESGDGIQAMKAGLMEIGDIFVINKADREGADGLMVEIESVLAMNSSQLWPPPVLKTIASSGEGTRELMEAIDEHRAWLQESGEGEKRRRQRIRAYVKEIVQGTVTRRLWQENDLEDRLENMLDDILEGRIDPFSAAEAILNDSVPPESLEGEKG
jgi:LAO/AO transport system kinase